MTFIELLSIFDRYRPCPWPIDTGMNNDRSSLRNEQWAKIEPILPGKVSDPGRSAADNRLFVEAVVYVARTGVPWRDLPPRFGAWNSIYKRFSRWSELGVWERVFAELSKGGDFEEVSLDSTIVRAHQHAAGAQKKREIKQLGALVAARRARIAKIRDTKPPATR